MSTFTLEIKPAPELTALIEKLLAAISPRSVTFTPNVSPQSPEELAARARMNPHAAATALPPRPAASAMPPQSPVYAQPPIPQQQFRPGPGAPGYPINVGPMQAAPYAMGNAPAVPTAPPAAPIHNHPAPPANPQLAPAGATPAGTAISAGPSTSQPGGYPSNAAPIATAPAYEKDDLARATATLADAGKIHEINQLFQQFQIQRMDQLPKERYGEYATALRGLGARI